MLGKIPEAVSIYVQGREANCYLGLWEHCKLICIDLGLPKFNLHFKARFRGPEYTRETGVMRAHM